MNKLKYNFMSKALICKANMSVHSAYSTGYCAEGNIYLQEYVHRASVSPRWLLHCGVAAIQHCKVTEVCRVERCASSVSSLLCVYCINPLCFMICSNPNFLAIH